MRWVKARYRQETAAAATGLVVHLDDNEHMVVLDATTYGDDKTHLFKYVIYTEPTQPLFNEQEDGDGNGLASS